MHSSSVYRGDYVTMRACSYSCLGRWAFLQLQARMQSRLNPPSRRRTTPFCQSFHLLIGWILRTLHGASLQHPRMRSFAGRTATSSGAKRISRSWRMMRLTASNRTARDLPTSLKALPSARQRDSSWHSQPSSVMFACALRPNRAKNHG
jgi:hypothetical protein